MEQNTSLIVPSDYENITREFHKIVTKLKHRTTPPRSVKKRSDGYFYPEFSYMQEEMDKFHPLRQEDITILPLDQTLPARVVVAIAKVTDLVTKEVRTGTDAHRVTFPKGELQKVENIVDLGNDIKSASTEALRNAYSRFGVCADIYQKQFKEEPTEAQNARFSSLMKDLPVDLNDPKVVKWIDDTRKAWATQNKDSADLYLEGLEKVVNKIKEKANGTVRSGQDAK